MRFIKPITCIALLAMMSCPLFAGSRQFNRAVRSINGKIARKQFDAARQELADTSRLAKSPADHSQLRLIAPRITMAEGRVEEAKAEYLAIASDEEADAGLRFRAYLIPICDAITDGKTLDAKEAIENYAISLKKAGLNNQKQYQIYNEMARMMTGKQNYALMREFLTMGDKLVKVKSKKVIVCKYVDKAPMGAAGWFLSDLIKDKQNRESRFEGYNKESARMLFTDITADRKVNGDASKKGYFFENTGIYMVYDKAGWHMFILCGDPDIEDKVDGGLSAGALEMFFAPGLKDVTYRQWIIRLPGGKISNYEWNSSHRFHRPMKEYMKTETVINGTNMGTYIFIPWESIYSKLPVNGEKWAFSMIRWSPAGGLTWGGKVHESGKWGHVHFQKPTSEQAAAIKRSIARKAWGKYQKRRNFLSHHWQDKMLGDGEFYSRKLAPAILNLNAVGERIKQHRTLSTDEVDRMFKQAVPDMMEFDYFVKEQRAEFLQEKLMK